MIDAEQRYALFVLNGARMFILPPGYPHNAARWFNSRSGTCNKHVSASFSRGNRGLTVVECNQNTFIQVMYFKYKCIVVVHNASNLTHLRKDFYKLFLHLHRAL